MGLFDVHAHLTDRRLLAREAEVLAAARAAGLTTVLSNGLNPADNAATAALAARSEGLVRPCFGLYPVDAVMPEMLAAGIQYHRDAEGEPPSGDEGVAWLREHVDEAFAIGEVGLDHYWVPESLWQRQEDLFREIIQLALDHDKALILHTRKAEQRAFDVLKEMGAARVDWHCFGGKVKLARQIAEHGHYLSIPSNVRRSQSFTRMVETLPRERVLLETDCPYLPPVPDTLNEPATVAGTAAFFAETWGVGVEEVHAQLEANFTALFRAAP